MMHSKRFFQLIILCLIAFKICPLLAKSAKHEEKKPEVVVTPVVEAAKEPTTPKAPTKVEWFYPRRGKKLDNGRIEVILTGRTAPGTPVNIKSDAVATMTSDGHIQQLEAKDTVPSAPIVADPQGYFVIKMALPAGTAQVPIDMKTEGAD